MNNDQLDNVRADQAIRLNMTGQDSNNPTIIAARLAREGWMPKPPIDPDLEEAQEIVRQHLSQKYAFTNIALAAIKRGRALAAEAKPGRWSSWNGAPSSPVCDNDWVCVIYDDQSQAVGRAGDRGWEEVSSYLPIPKPEDVA